MARAQLIGSWLLEPGQPDVEAELGRHAMLFADGGDLIYSIAHGDGVARMLLTWRVDGDALVTDQPSNPHEERTAFRLEGDELLVGDARYRRETGALFDPLARAFALGSFALRHAIASAVSGDAFAPFLMVVTPTGSDLLRVMATTAEAAEVKARALARQKAAATALAWVYDGTLSQGRSQTDAALATVSLPGVGSALVLAQAYRFAGAIQRAEPAGGVVLVHEASSWFDGALDR